jgi:hypothetical protein
MSLLYLRARPILAFNENDSLHRKYYYEFMTTRSWGHCPVRFMAEALNTSLVYHINERMLAYYVKQEFAKRIAKPKPKGASGAVRKKQPIQAKTGTVKKSVSKKTKAL